MAKESFICLINAKSELIEVLKDYAKVKCAVITDSYDKVITVLKLNYSDKEYSEFLNKLDFDYNHELCYGYLNGIVWLEDGNWLSRDKNVFWEFWRPNILPPVHSLCI